MTFVINAAPYVVFWGYGFIVALVAGAGLFGLPAALAAGAWAWVMTSVLKPAADESVPWSSRPIGMSIWAGLGVIAVVWPVVVWGIGTIPLL
jgi:hypothetical protein